MSCSEQGVSSSPLKTYEVAVGSLWVAIDFEAQAVSVSRGRDVKSARTMDLGDGFLADYDVDGFCVSVEAIG